MTEFGHAGVVGPGFCIDRWGAGPFEMTIKGRVHRFEDSDRFGPSRLSKRGDVLDYWPERHAFWRAHRQWVEQGRKVAEDGKTCVWAPSEPQPTTWYREGRRKIIMEWGDPEAGMIEVPRPRPCVITMDPAP